ncbi:lipid IV(A) 3-deoxy-D-manno-octulosonic acid transferase [Vibrio pectenicida]|uniref:3-deoxy-D-manno-octulosonic acid transferase n=1 Tax=Vibrio pectenicida TaxID=62763 RepID=A0A427U5R9_9VIBR|nr:lipid IV(A) 3-deoxy-D-manno-octulosonic acid transferase [Vibrio pectenicida]RSD32031.1 3-deoxy-D-manno-octulosonic acid transferase [Vibrio pectenicida]
MIIRILYTVLLSLSAPFLLYGLFRTKREKPTVGKRWKEHFGYSTKLSHGNEPVWIHAASVGETIAVTQFIREFKKQNPEQTILLTTTTPTGAKQAESLTKLVEHRYAPVDFPFAIKGFLKTFNPKKLLIVETELWPNLIHYTHQAGIPITVLNARLSEKSFLGYKRVLPIFSSMAQKLSQVLCQFEDDAERFIKLGVPTENVLITGSIKFDITITKESVLASNNLRETLGEPRPIWIAASTHAGEDELLLSAHSTILEYHPDALLIIVPRHPERFAHVTKLCVEKFTTITRSSGEKVSSSTEVYVGDSMGEMMLLLGAADICFMGGSLLGKKVGGHNLLEPAALGLPTLTGPSYYNFKDITNSLIAAGACKVVNNSVEITAALNEALSNPVYLKSAGEASKHFVQLNSGAVAKALAFIG